MSYRATLDTLYNMMPDFQQVGWGAYKPGLERVTEFLGMLGNPHERFRSVHIAGTNGKGSTAHMMAAVLQRAGHKVGLYTSPHLTDFRERMRIDGSQISEEEVVEFAERWLPTMQELRLSFFEASMCMAFDWFARRETDIAVVEAGLGGRLDSTNVLTPLVSVITNIGLDHQQFLGSTLAEIAAEKAGIIKPGVPVVIGERGTETDDVFETKAAAMGSQIIFAEDKWEVSPPPNCHSEHHAVMRGISRHEANTFTLDLHGACQQKNLTTLLAALDVLKIPIETTQKALPTAALTTGLRGRWETLGHDPLTIADTAHNAHGLRYVVEQLKATHHRTLYMVFGVVADKDLSEILPLLPREAHYIFTAPAVARALPARELAKKAEGLTGETVDGVREALERARELAKPEDLIFVGGSNFIVSEVL